MNSRLPIELYEQSIRIEKIAQSYGLDYFPVQFEMVGWKEMNELAAYGGFPTRYPHWKFGMEYNELSQSYKYGLHKIYEMVINTDPCIAYLLDCNPLVDQKLVMAHVYGHAHFFKHNYLFGKTDKNMLNVMANHAIKVRKYIDKYGHDVVEEFIDCCLSIDNLVDLNVVFRTKDKPKEEDPYQEEIKLLPSEDYMNDFINPPEFKEAQRQKIEEKKNSSRRFPEKLTRDVMGFLAKYGSLAEWQRDILSMLREESLYFSPQGMTKIMNEGWASYWHTKIMTGSDLADKYTDTNFPPVLTPDEVIDFADHHSGTVAQGKSLNPYKLGLDLIRDIEERWNKGQFGPEYDNCTDLNKKKAWDTGAGKGREKIFEIIKYYNDVSFIEEFLTPEFCVKYNLFGYSEGLDENGDLIHFVDTKEFEEIKRRFVKQLHNFGQPFISVKDANYENAGELLLYHQYEGSELKLSYVQEVLKNIFCLWGRPVNLETIIDEEVEIISYNGKTFSGGVDFELEEEDEDF